MKSKEALTANYRCPKCHGREAATRKGKLVGARLPDLLGIADTSYLFVTCTLCGYTEIYDRAIYVKSREAAKQENPATQQA